MENNSSTLNFFVNTRWNIAKTTLFLYEIFTLLLMVLLRFVTSSLLTFSYQVIPLDEKKEKKKPVVFWRGLKAQ